jgi:hypothetical protein
MLLIHYLVGKSYIRLQTIWASISQTIRKVLSMHSYTFDLFFRFFLQVNYETSRFYETKVNSTMEIENDPFKTLFLEDYYEDLDKIDTTFVL